MIEIELQKLGFTKNGMVFEKSNDWVVGFTEGFIWIRDVYARVVLNWEITSDERCVDLIRCFFNEPKQED